MLPSTTLDCGVELALLLFDADDTKQDWHLLEMANEKYIQGLQSAESCHSEYDTKQNSILGTESVPVR